MKQHDYRLVKVDTMCAILIITKFMIFCLYKLFISFLGMHPKDYNINPTNMTDVINKKGVSNRDNNILLYILIVVGASILLLLIPLIRYIAQWSKRKMRRRRRRKQIEKAYGNFMPFIYNNAKHFYSLLSF